MNKFQISNFGPIKNLDVELGDLTILLGPQASGKTLFLQLAKLIVDKDYIVQNLLKYNYVIDGDSDKVLNYYFGDRLSSMWKNCTMVKVDGEAFEKCSLLNAENADAKERLFYIPAQRILSISDGRPKISWNLTYLRHTFCAISAKRSDCFSNTAWGVKT